MSRIDEIIQRYKSEGRISNGNAFWMFARIKQLRDAGDSILQGVSIDRGKLCPHGNSGDYPTHGWYCDECFIALERALEALR